MVPSVVERETLVGLVSVEVGGSVGSDGGTVARESRGTMGGGRADPTLLVPSPIPLDLTNGGEYLSVQEGEDSSLSIDDEFGTVSSMPSSAECRTRDGGLGDRAEWEDRGDDAP